MNILLVRHGETAWNREGRYQGRTDIPLSPVGETQVAALGARLSGIAFTAAIASPLSRARTTAEAVLGAPGQLGAPHLELDDGLVEISHGTWEGQLSRDVELAHTEMYGAWRDKPGRDVPAGPGAETLGDVEARAWPVLARLVSKLSGDQTGLLAAHDAVNRVLLCRVLGLPLARVWTFRQAPATLNVLSGPSLDLLELVRLNDSEHIGPLLAEPKHRAL